MAIQVDELTTSVTVGAMNQVMVGMAQGQAFVMEQGRLGYQEGLRQMGVREAAAMQEMRTSGQSREILQAQAALEAPRRTTAAA